jgi:4-amino-4-deoxy-L-arabinose transferase-like glycosyltransferase
MSGETGKTGGKPALTRSGPWSRILPSLPRGATITLALFAGAALVRLVRLGADGLWTDEAWTALLVRRSPHAILDLLRNDDAPPLFYLLEKTSALLTGGAEWGLRLLPALAGLGAVALAWRLCRDRAPRAALPVAAALGFSSVAVHYSRQARSYSLLHLLALLAMGAAISLRENPGKRTAAWFLLACLGLAYSHNLGVLLVVAALLTGVLPLLVSRPHRRSGALVLAILALGMIPWLSALQPQLGTHSGGNAWMGLWWKGRGPVLLGFLYSPAAMANGAAAALRPTVPLPAFGTAVAALRAVSWGLVALGLAAALSGMRRRDRTGARRPGPRGSHPGDQPHAELRLRHDAAAFAIVPLLGLIAISLLVGPAYVVGRTDTLALPGLLLLLGLGWSCGPRLMAPIAAGLWVALGLAALAPSWTGTARTAKGADRALAALLAERIAPGDAVVFSVLSRPSLEYYGRRLTWWDRAGWKGSFPASFDRNAAATWPTPLDSAAAWQQEAIKLRAEWERSNTRTAWVLALRDPAGAASAEGKGSSPAWPSRPAPPPSTRGRLGAQSLAYPGNILVSALVGLKPVEVAWEYRQDWVSGDRLVLRLSRDSWTPLDSIPRLEARP